MSGTRRPEYDHLRLGSVGFWTDRRGVDHYWHDMDLSYVRNVLAMCVRVRDRMMKAASAAESYGGSGEHASYDAAADAMCLSDVAERMSAHVDWLTDYASWREHNDPSEARRYELTHYEER